MAEFAQNLYTGLLLPAIPLIVTVIIIILGIWIGYRLLKLCFQTWLWLRSSVPWDVERNAIALVNDLDEVVPLLEEDCLQYKFAGNGMIPGKLYGAFSTRETVENPREYDGPIPGYQNGVDHIIPEEHLLGDNTHVPSSSTDLVPFEEDTRFVEVETESAYEDFPTYEEWVRNGHQEVPVRDQWRAQQKLKRQSLREQKEDMDMDQLDHNKLKKVQTPWIPVTTRIDPQSVERGEVLVEIMPNRISNFRKYMLALLNVEFGRDLKADVANREVVRTRLVKNMRKHGLRDGHIAYHMEEITDMFFYRSKSDLTRDQRRQTDAVRHRIEKSKRSWFSTYTIRELIWGQANVMFADTN
jgi:hypothetical protein